MGIKLNFLYPDPIEGKKTVRVEFTKEERREGFANRDFTVYIPRMRGNPAGIPSPEWDSVGAGFPLSPDLLAYYRAI